MSLFNLFRPKWKHSDAQVRLNEVRELPIESNQSPFEEIARKDSDAKIRSIAAAKILSIDTLISILSTESNSDVQKSIKKRIDDLIQDQILSTTVQSAWLPYISEIKTLEMAIGSPLLEIRKFALSKTNKEALILEALLVESDEALATELFQKLDKEDSFVKAQKAKLSAIQTQAKEYLTKVQAEKARIEAEKRMDAQVNSIESALNRLASALHILEHTEEVQTLAEAWKQIPSHKQSSSVQSLLNLVSQKLTEALEQQKKLELEKQQQVEWKNKALHLCELMENLCKVGEINQESEANELTAQWTELQKSTQAEWDFCKSWQDRFSLNQENWKIRLERLIAAQAPVEIPTPTPETTNETPVATEVVETESAEAIAARQAEEKIIQEKTKALEAIIESVKAMDPNGDFEQVQEALKQAHFQWKEISQSHRDLFLPLWKNFKEACIPFEEVNQWAKWHNENKKQTLVEEIEALVQSDKPNAQVYQEYRTIQEAWKTAGSISHEKHQELWGRFKVATDAIIQRCQSFFEERNAEREENLTLKKALCEEMKAAIESTVNEQGDILKQFQERWKVIGPVPREANDTIWQEYRSLCDQLYNKRKNFLQNEHDHRVVNLKLKEEICAKVEALTESKDWIEGSKQIRFLQEEWKKVGFVPKADSDGIWTRFRNACDAFFNQKREYFEGVDAQKKFNLAQKVALCEEIEAIKLNDLNETMLARLEVIKEEWKNIGHVSKEDSDLIWDRYCRATDAILEKQAESNPDLKSELAKRVQLKEEIIAKAAEAAESSDWATASNALQDLQNQWKEIGRAGVADQDLWNNFRKVCDAFFERKRDHYEIMEQHRINNYEEKLALIEEAERIAAGTHDENAKHEIKQLRYRWKEIGQVPRKHADKIWKRFNKACDVVFALEQKEEE